jgi:LPXTG-motif cell wall-anchored protein
MERLKAILADKILDLSAGNGEDVKVKIDKIQRFRDFANACKTLMIKYPSIEDELINMVEDGDFDTKVASSRVDTVIRLTDKAAQPIIPTPQIEEYEESGKPDSEIIPDIDDIPMEVYQGEEEQVYQPEDIDYEELDPSSGKDSNEDYVPFEEFTENMEPDTVTEQMLEYEAGKESNHLISEEDESAAKRKLTIRRVTQAIGAVLVIVALIFIVKFVMVHWQTILIIAGALLILVILFFWFKRKRS